MGKCNEKPRYYFGIDLGTTNSVLAWAQASPDEQISPEVAQIQMISRPGAKPIKNELFPSCVYFDNQNAIVGQYAKNMLISDHKKVHKSIKTQMGTNGPIPPSNLTPPQISSNILEALVDGLPSNFPKEELLNQAVIGVPASFPDAMRKATREAAIMAGFQEPIELLDEPTAALYDYSNLQNRGERMTNIPNGTVLVFDLGGGTLDVSLHSVSYTRNQNPASIEKIKTEKIDVSRYFNIGGDYFDDLLAEHFLNVYEGNLGSLSATNRENLKPKFQEYAEQAKMFLSREIENTKIQRSENFDPETISIDFKSRNIHGKPNKVFNYKLTLTEYENIVSQLLAYDLTLGAVTQPSNIIYPILDVLEKGKAKLGSVPKLEAVLLNGAMTKLHTIQKRIEDFFEPVPILYIGDPDRAVARGAVVHHYNLKNP